MIKSYDLSYSNTGWFLSVSEKPTGSWLVEKAIGASCFCWWGQYGNLPFCWINPWGWTWKVGTEERSLGSAWMAVGHWLHRLEDRGWRELVRIPLTKEQASAIDAGFVESLEFLEEPNECEGHADCPRCDTADPCPCCGVKAAPVVWERLMTLGEIRAELGLAMED